ncbi:MAG TPA: flavin-dependent oxidoreductase [Trebonia sp.]|nr:flavin-dependent oxidoreductase [Trebonia sp.]
MRNKKPNVVIVGAGIGGLTLALELHAAGVECVLLEATRELTELGVGINLLPHATRSLSRLGLRDALANAAVTTKESVFFTRHGQLIYREPAGLDAGYAWPQFSVHRGDLQRALSDAVRDRLGADAIRLGHRVTGFAQDDAAATVTVEHADGTRSRVSGDVLVGADGVHSVVRMQLHPEAGVSHYTGYTMWRGTTVHPPFLSGASMVRAGWLATGKLVAYPIRDNVDGNGSQLVNWLAEVEGPQRAPRDWTRRGHLEDFIANFEDWHFDWLDVPALFRGAQEIFEYPTVDSDPLPWWTQGRVTLLGDAAHPMVPRGSNGSAQAILDAKALATLLAGAGDSPEAALRAYDDERREATGLVVLTNRRNPPDALLREVYERTGDQPFDNISDVISEAEITAMMSAYRNIAGFSAGHLAAP